MDKKLKIDPKKVEYDGHSFRLIIEDEASFLERLKQKQGEILEDLKKTEDKSGSPESEDQSAETDSEKQSNLDKAVNEKTKMLCEALEKIAKEYDYDLVYGYAREAPGNKGSEVYQTD